ncbi:MAG: hypothetical protein COC15_02935 [Legionellales bacterium]|nr:MAG: hypothetical protein COC15_02935 [Legionellales bacterium]
MSNTEKEMINTDEQETDKPLLINMPINTEKKPFWTDVRKEALATFATVSSSKFIFGAALTFALAYMIPALIAPSLFGAAGFAALIQPIAALFSSTFAQMFVAKATVGAFVGSIFAFAGLAIAAAAITAVAIKALYNVGHELSDIPELINDQNLGDDDTISPLMNWTEKMWTYFNAMSADTNPKKALRYGALFIAAPILSVISTALHLVASVVIGFLQAALDFVGNLAVELTGAEGSFFANAKYSASQSDESQKAKTVGVGTWLIGVLLSTFNATISTMKSDINDKVNNNHIAKTAPAVYDRMSSVFSGSSNKKESNTHLADKDAGN